MEESNYIRTLAKKYSDGDHLTDLQMFDLLDAYKAVVESTLRFGDRYSLVLEDANQKLHSIGAAINNRMNRK